MANFSYIVLFTALALTSAQGSEEQSDTCGMDDATCLLQTHVLHKKRAMEMSPVLADLEKAVSAIPQGQHVLHQLLQGVMALPALKNEREVRAAVHAHPQLQHLRRRYPQLAHAMAMLEHPQTIEALQNHVRRNQNRHPRVITPSKRVPHRAGFLDMKKAHRSGQTLLIWTEGWGCDMNVSVMDYPQGSFMDEFALFGEEPCYGWPSISNLMVDIEAHGGYFVIGNSSYIPNYTYSYSLGFASEDGVKILGSLGDKWHYITFMPEFDKFVMTWHNGNWSGGGAYELVIASVSEAGGLFLSTLSTNTSTLGCAEPSGIYSVPGTSDVIVKCNKDWNLPSDKHKLVKIETETLTSSILVESDDWISTVEVTKSDVFYNQYEYNYTTYVGVYELYMISLEKQNYPIKLADLPRDAYEFLITKSSVLFSEYDYWDPVTGNSMYNLTEIDEHGMSKTLGKANGFQNAQLVVYDALGGTDDLDSPKDDPVPATPDVVPVPTDPVPATGDVVSGTFEITKDEINVKIDSE